MTDSEARAIILKTTELRLSTAYQAAEALRRDYGAMAMAQATENSREHAALRLLIGTWERIAISVQDFSPGQRNRFFRCHPVGLVWAALEPAVRAIREGGEVGPRFAIELENLAAQYHRWTQTKAGEQYRTAAQQAVCALFA